MNKTIIKVIVLLTVRSKLMFREHKNSRKKLEKSKTFLFDPQKFFAGG